MVIPRRFFFLLLTLLAALSACEEEELPEIVKFTFVAPVSISPGRDTVSRGDTLWVTVDFSDSLYDLRSKRRYRLPQPDITLTTSLGFHRLLGPTQFSAGFAPGFTVVNKMGELLPGGPTFRRFALLYDGQRYRARIGVIPQVAGVFALSFLSTLDDPFGPERPLPFLKLSPNPDGRERRANLDNIYYVINDGDTHFGLQQQHSRVVSLVPNATQDAILYEQKGTFTFVVR